MTTSTRILLVEDNPGDAAIVTALLAQADAERYDVVHVNRVSEAIATLQNQLFDVVLLDLRLPDTSGLNTVERVDTVAKDTPFVVLTGTDDEALALSCIDAGAQDYVCKADMKAATLRRTIEHAISRHREAQVRDLQNLLGFYRDLSSAGSRTSITASLARSGAIQDRHEHEFGELTRRYSALLTAYMDQLPFQKSKPRRLMARLITEIGDRGGGPRDLLDVHVAALDAMTGQVSGLRARSLAFEGRLLALEMMGLLVDYYRVGGRGLVDTNDDDAQQEDAP